MDELNMDSLELPDTGHSYDNLPDASDTAESISASQQSASDSIDSIDEIAMPVLSEMDGTESFSAAAPASSDWKKPSDNALSMPAFEEMGDINSTSAVSTASESTSYDNNSADSSYRNTDPSRKRYSTEDYQSSNFRNSSPTSLPNMDTFFEERKTVDPAKFEKGKKRVKVIAIAAMVLYGINTLGALVSLMNGGIFVILDLLVNGFLLFQAYRFLNGSDKARNIFGYIVVLSLIIDIANTGSVLVAGAFTSGAGAAAGLGSLGMIVGLLSVVLHIGTIIFDIALAYFLFADESVAEYTKGR